MFIRSLQVWHGLKFQLKGIDKNMRCKLLQKRSTGKTTGCSKHLQHIAIAKYIFSELNRCIFQISLKYIKLFQKYSLYWYYPILIFTSKLCDPPTKLPPPPKFLTPPAKTFLKFLPPPPPPKSIETPHANFLLSRALCTFSVRLMIAWVVEKFGRKPNCL